MIITILRSPVATLVENSFTPRARGASGWTEGQAGLSARSPSISRAGQGRSGSVFEVGAGRPVGQGCGSHAAWWHGPGWGWAPRAGPGTMRQSPGEGGGMPEPKTLHERERELQALMATPDGRDALEELAGRYRAAGGRMRPENTSVITYIIVHERSVGLIAG